MTFVLVELTSAQSGDQDPEPAGQQSGGQHRACIGLNLELSLHAKKILPWHTWSPCSVVHILFRLCKRVEVRNPGVTIIFPCYVISTLFMLR